MEKETEVERVGLRNVLSDGGTGVFSACDVKSTVLEAGTVCSLEEMYGFLLRKPYYT